MADTLTTKQAAQKLKRYRLLGKDDLKGVVISGPAVVTDVFLSSIVLVVQLKLDLPQAAANTAAREPDGLEPVRKQVRTLMRLVADRLREHGVDCPSVALLSPRGTGAALSVGAANAFRVAYGSLASNQDWHRGEFLVFVEEGRDRVQQRLVDLLEPEPPQVNIRARAQNLPDVIKACVSVAENNLVLRALLEAWRTALEYGEEAGDLGASLDERCSVAGERGLEAVVRDATRRADVLFEEVR